MMLCTSAHPHLNYKVKCLDHIFVQMRFFFHMSNSHECMGVNGEALELRAVHKKPYFILQVMRGSVSGSLNPIGQHLYMSVT